MTAETTTARAELVAALVAGLPAPAWRVLGYARDLDAVEGPTVLAWCSDMARGPVLDGRGGVTVTYSVWVLSGLEDADAVDDELDVSLDAVLDVLTGVRFVDWTSAERGVYQNKWHGWKITLTAIAELVPTAP